MGASLKGLNLLRTTEGGEGTRYEKTPVNDRNDGNYRNDRNDGNDRNDRNDRNERMNENDRGKIFFFGENKFCG